MSPLTPSTRRAMMIAGVVALVSAGAIPGVALAANLRHARPAVASPSISMIGISNGTVLTSKGIRLKVYVDASKLSVAGSKSTFGVNLAGSTGTNGSSEFHTWSFNLTSNSFAYNAATGTASVLTGTQMNPFGIASLKFSKKSVSHPSCKTGSELTVQGNLSGNLYFNTNASWGALGSKVKNFAFAVPASLTLDYDCIPSTPTVMPPCVKSISWTAPITTASSPQSTEIVTGSSTATSGKPNISTITSIRSVRLPHPAGALRQDYASENAPAATYNSATKGLTVTTAAGSKLITGGASLAKGTSYSPPPTACKAGSVTKSQTNTDTFNVTWTNASSPLTVHMSVGGSFYIKNSASGGNITRETY